MNATLNDTGLRSVILEGALCPWAVLDSVISLGVVVTAVFIFIASSYSENTYPMKVTFASCHLSGVMFGTIRTVTALSIARLQGTGKPISTSLCIVFISLQMLFFSGFYVSSVFAFVFGLQQLVNPLYNRRSRVWTTVVGSWVVLVGLYVAPIYSFVRTAQNQTVTWFKCTWAVCPEWFVTLSLYGVATPALIAAIVISALGLKVAMRQSSRIADQINNIKNNEQGKQRRWNWRKQATQLYATLWMMITVVLYVERFVAYRYALGSVISWSVLSLTVLICNILTLQNRMLAQGVRRFLTLCQRYLVH